MSKQIDDIIMKSIIELFKGDAIKFFGINKKVVSAARTELIQFKVQKNIDDWILFTEDNSYIHFEFQTTTNKEDLSRFMVSDAMLCYKEGKPVKTIVVCSSDIESTITTLNYGAIHYQVDAFYLLKLDGDKNYDRLKDKIETGEALTKQDLMSIVFLPLMKNSVDKTTRIGQAIELSKELREVTEQLQIQAMLDMLAEKFITDKSELSKIKELLSMGAIAQMIRDDAFKEYSIEIAKKLLKRGMSIIAIAEDTGLDESTIRQLQVEADND